MSTIQGKNIKKKSITIEINLYYNHMLLFSELSGRIYEHNTNLNENFNFITVNKLN